MFGIKDKVDVWCTIPYGLIYKKCIVINVVLN